MRVDDVAGNICLALGAGGRGREQPGTAAEDRAANSGPPRQGLTLVHFSAQRKHILWDTLSA